MCIRDRDNNDNDDSWIQIASASGGGGTALTVAGNTDIATINVAGGLIASSDTAGEVELSVTNPTFDTPTQSGTTVVVNVNPGNGSFTLPAATRTLAGVMIGTDKARLDDLITYNLTAVSGSDRLLNPSELTFSSDGNSFTIGTDCLLYTSPSPRDRQKSRMPSSA